MQILNMTKNTVLARDASLADTFVSRMKGLLGRASLGHGEALVITRCNSIHMFFMRFAIDAVFVDKHDAVVGLVKNIRPFQLSPVFFRASFVLELPCGVIEQSQTQIGDRISLIPQ